MSGVGGYPFCNFQHFLTRETTTTTKRTRNTNKHICEIHSRRQRHYTCEDDNETHFIIIKISWRRHSVRGRESEPKKVFFLCCVAECVCVKLQYYYTIPYIKHVHTQTHTHINTYNIRLFVFFFFFHRAIRGGHFFIHRSMDGGWVRGGGGSLINNIERGASLFTDDGKQTRTTTTTNPILLLICSSAFRGPRQTYWFV